MSMNTIDRRLRALETRMTGPAWSTTSTEADLIRRGIAAIHDAGWSLTDVEALDVRLSAQAATAHDLTLLSALAASGQQDPTAFIRQIADLSRAV